MAHHTILIRLLTVLLATAVFSGTVEGSRHSHDVATAAHSHTEIVLGSTAIRQEAPLAPGVYGADAETAALINWAIERYAQAGLELPGLTIHVHNTSEGCGGHMGLYTPSEPVARIDICTVGQWVVLHELAHAWEHHNVDDATRQRFLEVSGKPVWNDWGHAATERATEAAANAIAFGLRTDPVDLDRATDTQLAMLDAYELLTGMPSQRLD